MHGHLDIWKLSYHRKVKPASLEDQGCQCECELPRFLVSLQYFSFLQTKVGNTVSPMKIQGLFGGVESGCRKGGGWNRNVSAGNVEGAYDIIWFIIWYILHWQNWILATFLAFRALPQKDSRFLKQLVHGRHPTQRTWSKRTKCDIFVTIPVPVLKVTQRAF